jgi:hypothetical protein
MAAAMAGLPGADGAVVRAAELTAFRITSLELRDPHLFVRFLLVLCEDATAGFNDEIETRITSDEDQDGHADLNLLFAFRPLDSESACGAVAAGEARCTMPLDTTSCSREPAQGLDLLVFENDSTATCLASLPGTTDHPYDPPVGPTPAPCFVTVTFDLRWAPFPVPIIMEDAQIAATYSGSPPTRLINGLVRGFVSEMQADAAILPESFPVIGGQPLSVALPGGRGNCAGHDDRDLGPDGVTRGWWLYLNFTAEPVPFTCNHPADLNTSCTADLDDLPTLQQCLSGTAADEADCVCPLADVNNDLFLDLRDYAAFQACASGPAGPVDPGCTGP